MACALALQACGGAQSGGPASALAAEYPPRPAPVAAEPHTGLRDDTGTTAAPPDARPTLRKVVDTRQCGMVAAAFAAPASWTDHSEIEWNYADMSRPMTMTVAVKNPQGVEGFWSFPSLDLFWSPQAARIYRPGQHTGGLIFAQPMAPLATLEQFVRETRANVQNLRFVAERELPDAPRSPELPPSANQRGVLVAVNYEIDHRPVEEEFHATYYVFDAPYDGPHGRVWQRDWGLKAPGSIRAASGRLDALRPTFNAISASFQVNPAWLQRVQQVDRALAQRFDAVIRKDFADIDAAGERGRQIVAQSNAFLARIDQQIVASRQTGGGGVGGGRSQNDLQDDYIRGVETTDDPTLGTSQHSLMQTYHWTDGNGGYRDSNDANYNPNHTENGNWVQMPAASH
ncbi:MAG: hypothetical protein QM741_09755 [Rudaea sp.]|uniref:hypothetical protein n=1 Tax=Rudaea sp. TaxID=2136325 RepID=UPI0039E53788